MYSLWVVTIEGKPLVTHYTSLPGCFFPALTSPSPLFFSSEFRLAEGQRGRRGENGRERAQIGRQGFTERLKSVHECMKRTKEESQTSSTFPETMIPRAALSLEERMFPAHSGVTAVYSVSRHPGPPYPGHDLSKTHPNLAGTPPGHATSPALSQVSVPAAPSYRFLKGWETGGGPPYNPAQNAGSAPLVYSPQTQPMNVQPQTRPVSTAPQLHTVH
ncbi:hypothetical protein H4Q32_023361 [Labeo rohita]|uniref:Uncharacterized protein n=1 Tax=Labeo rohita TaxID=84645 RepID=A0ABQ8M8E2_LABRO|nr:hypothetical protein H4Q32_023361 [Labeo rohita]